MRQLRRRRGWKRKSTSSSGRGHTTGNISRDSDWQQWFDDALHPIWRRSFLGRGLCLTRSCRLAAAPFKTTPYLLLLQLSPTAFTEVAAIVFVAVAVAVAPVDPEELLPALAFASPAAEPFGALVSGLLPAEAEALEPTVPITSTCLFTLALSCESSP